LDAVEEQVVQDLRLILLKDQIEELQRGKCQFFLLQMQGAKDALHHPLNLMLRVANHRHIPTSRLLRIAAILAKL
jgi:hypothetical protein